jgi:hypothetical protein
VGHGQGVTLTGHALFKKTWQKHITMESTERCRVKKYLIALTDREIATVGVTLTGHADDIDPKNIRRKNIPE